jgi:hypothetical protein
VDSAGHILHDRLGVIYSTTGYHTVTEDGDLLFIENRDKVSKLTSDGTVTTLFTTDRPALCIHSSRINAISFTEGAPILSAFTSVVGSITRIL